jgi:hypothetical protein
VHADSADTTGGSAKLIGYDCAGTDVLHQVQELKAVATDASHILATGTAGSSRSFLQYYSVKHYCSKCYTSGKSVVCYLELEIFILTCVH